MTVMVIPTKLAECTVFMMDRGLLVAAIMSVPAFVISTFLYLYFENNISYALIPFAIVVVMTSIYVYKNASEHARRIQNSAKMGNIELLEVYEEPKYNIKKNSYPYGNIYIKCINRNTGKKYYLNNRYVFVKTIDVGDKFLFVNSEIYGKLLLVQFRLHWMKVLDDAQKNVMHPLIDSTKNQFLFSSSGAQEMTEAES